MTSSISFGWEMAQFNKFESRLASRRNLFLNEWITEVCVMVKREDELKIKQLEVELFSGDEKRYWKAAADLRGFVEQNPSAIWSLVVKAGSSDLDDLRVAIANDALEHILDSHFDEYFPKVEEIVKSGNTNFRITLGHCYPMDQAATKENRLRWEKLIYDSANKEEKESLDFRNELKKYKEMAERGDPEGIAGLKRLREM